MDDLKHQIEALMAELSRVLPAAGTTEGKALQHLKRIQEGMTHGYDPRDLASAVNELRQFWLDSVAWCSALSRDIEKIIMIHGELLEAAARSHLPGE